MSSEPPSEVTPFGRVAYHGYDKCPACGQETLEIVELHYEVPLFGNMILYSYVCRACGYRYVDLQYLEERRWKIMKYRIEDLRDVTETMIFRSKTCRVYSPELGFSIDPGVAAEAFITTAEGLLYKVLDYAEKMYALSDNEEEKQKIQEFMEKIRKALKGEIEFTIVLEDPLGNSLIRPPRGRESKLVTEDLIAPPKEQGE